MKDFVCYFQKGIKVIALRARSKAPSVQRGGLTAVNGVRMRKLKPRIGRLTLNAPRYWIQPFRTMLFENYSRSEQLPLSTVAVFQPRGSS